MQTKKPSYFCILALICHFNIAKNLDNSFDKNLNFLKSYSNETDENSKFYHLFNFIKDIYTNAQIKDPLEIEYSIKISKNNINKKRYIIRINRNVLQKLNGKTDKLLYLIPNTEIRQKISNYIKGYPGALIYGIDLKNKPIYKVYYDYPRIFGFGIESYKWEDKKTEAVTHKYRQISIKYESYRKNLNKYLTKKQIQALSKLKNRMNLDNLILRKDDTGQDTVYFSFKKNVTIDEIKGNLIDLTRDLIDLKQIMPYLNSIKKSKISWLAIGNEGITIYFRLSDWQ